MTPDGALDPDAALAAAGATTHSPRSAPGDGARAFADETANGVQLRLIDPRSWTSPAPPRRWIVRDWIPQGHVTALYGDGGVGKSLLAQQLLSSAALGLPWLGLDTARVRALGVFCEDEAEELQRRQEAINAALGFRMADLGDLGLVSRLGDDNLLMTFERGDAGAATPFFAALDAKCREFTPGIIVLDTAADLFGGNELVRAQVRRFVASCLGRLARDHDCAVVLLAHPSRDGIISKRGDGASTAWSNTVRSRLYLAALDGDDGNATTDARTLTRMKANYAAKGEALELQFRNGVIGRRTTSPGGACLPDWQLISAMYDEIERAWSAGRPYSSAPQTRSHGRYFPMCASKQFGIPEKVVGRLLADWLAAGNLGYEEFDRRNGRFGLRVLRKLSP